MKTSEFLSCDWGTSTFRLHLIDGVDDVPVATVESAEGINAVHGAWKAAGALVAEREPFYLEVVRRQVDLLARQSGRLLTDLPLIMSGMASATVGVRELPYKELPFAADGSGLHFEMRPASAELSHPLVIISGARGPDDVMRGEETQLVGAITRQPAGDGLFIFPGTHSKHVQVRDFHAITLKTYMTGEFFDLLSRHSILANSIEPGECDTPEARAAFSEGVLSSGRGNLLHTSFGVRVGQIFGRRNRLAGYQYLSGLLVGAELRESLPSNGTAVTLVGNPTLVARYEQALRLLDWGGTLATISAESAVIAGQRRIAAATGFLPSTG